MKVKGRLEKVFLLFCFLSFLIVKSQQRVTVDDQQFTVQELVEDVLIDSPCAVVENITSFTGTAQGFNGIGYFQANNSNFEIEKGIVLSTGNARNAAGPNSTELSDGNNQWVGDFDLRTVTGTSALNNATYIQFEFVPTIDFISFDFLFASEEYTQNFPCTFSDVFAFILTDSSGNSRNLAVVPGTNPAVPIKVTTVHPGVDLNNDGDFNDTIGVNSECPPQNENYFNTKIPQGNTGAINFNGYTEVLTASGSVVVNERYTIKLVIADNSDSAFDSAVFLAGGSFDIGGDLGDDRTIATGNPGCLGTPIVLNATLGTGSTYAWLKDGNPLAPGDGTTILAGGAQLEVTQDGVYSVTIDISGGCNTTESVIIEFDTPPTVQNTVTLLQCDDDTDGFSLFNLSEANTLVSNNADNEVFTYYLTEQQAINGTMTGRINDFTAYPNPTITNSTVYARVETTYCFETARVDLQVSTTQIPANFNLTYTLCDNNDSDPTDGVATFNFSDATAQIEQLFSSGQNLTIRYYQNEADALSEQNAIADISNYRNESSPLNQNIYVRVENGVANSCLGLGEHITLVALPIIPIPIEDEYAMCLDSDDTFINLVPTDEIDTGLSATNYTFKWYTGTSQTPQNEIAGETQPFFLPNTPGIYTVVATNIQTGCELSKSTEVVVSYPPESATTELLSGAFSNNAKIAVTVEGNGQYEFRIDNGDWQESNIFEGVSRGEHTVYVRDFKMCGELAVEVEKIVSHPEYFTPNGDGFHDLWDIEGSENVTILDVTIFDRYGKLLADLGASGIWDGTYNGNILPSSDYWFRVQYIEEGITKEFKSSFSLIR